MAQRFLTNVDLTQNQIINAKFEVVGSDPGSNNFEGRMIYNSTEDVIKVYSGSAWRKMIHAVSSSTTALVSSESNGTVSLSIADVVAGAAHGLMTGADKSKLDNATSSNTNLTLALRDASGRLQVSAPSADLDAANKAYVDAARSGLDVKQSVRVATTAPQTLASDFENGDVIDGVTLVTGDRILIKNQSTGSENGIYVVAVSGAPTRATDADSNTEVTSGMFTFVEEGTVNADSGFVLTTNSPITLDSTALTFVQFSGAGQITAGDGLTKTGNTLDVGGTANRITVNADTVDIASTYVGQSSITTLGTITTGVWNGTDVAVADGGTGASTASDARANLAATAGHALDAEPVLARVGHKVIGDGSNTSFTITHNFGTRDVIVQVYDVNASPTYETVHVDVVRTNTNTVTVSFASAPANNSYRVVITG